MTRKVLIAILVAAILVVGLPILLVIHERHTSFAWASMVESVFGRHPSGFTECLRGMNAVTGDADLPAEVEADCLRAAKAGDSQAQWLMGRIARHQAKDEAGKAGEAVRWYEAASKQNNYYAMYDLAMMYFTGDGVAVDYSRALELFMSAAQHKLPAAQIALARMYATGNGVPEDDAQAVGWLTIALKSKDLPARSAEPVQSYRDQLMETLTPDQQAQAAAMALKF